MNALLNRIPAQLTLGLAVTTLAPAASADTLGVAAPSFRGEPGSGYIVFDSFIGGGATGQVFGAAPGPSGGGVTGTITQALALTPPAGILGGTAPADNRVYVHDSAASWTLSITTPNPTGVVELNVKEVAGSGLASIPTLLDGVAPDSTAVYGDGLGNSITRYEWSGLGGVSSFDITLSVPAGTTVPPGTFDSYDSFTVDTAVPEPGSLALLGLGGLMVVRRRRG